MFKNHPSLPALAALVALLGLSACYPYLSPKGPVTFTPNEVLGVPANAPSGFVYGDKEPLAGHPVLPFRLWGLDFDEEMVFELAKHPEYAMIEVTRMVSRQGEEEWFAVVAEHTGTQHVATGSSNAAGFARSFPAPSYDGQLRVIRLQGDGAVEYDAAFYLPNGQMLQVSAQAKDPGNVPRRRNGNAVNHSADRALAVIDIKEQSWAKVSVYVDEERAPIRLLAPFLPLAMRLEQVAGGLAFGGVNTEPGPEDSNVAVIARLDNVDEPVSFVRRSRGGLVELVGEDAVAEHIYRFRPVERGKETPALELVEAEVQHGTTQAVRFRFNPALPDLRYTPDRIYESQFVVAVNGQDGYATGVARVYRDGDRNVVDVVPHHPFWACERPMRVRLQFVDGVVRLRSEITPALAAGGVGRDACFEIDKDNK